ncbi:MAG: MltA domain-containing protein [Syntrophobacteraceae bacterium]
MGIKRRSAVFWLICLLVLTGCPSKPPQTPQQSSERPLLERISAAELPDFQDDGSAESLRLAMEKSLSWYTKNSQEKPVSLGNISVPSKVFVESIKHFAALADSGPITADVLWKNFDIFRIVPPDNSGRMFVTGYYEPVVEGSLKPGAEFRWPIYPVPSDLLVIELGRFDSNKFHGERLVGRLEGKYFVPYYSRAEIDGKSVLEKPGAQSATPLAKPLAWLKDPVDCFFLHIQGSGVIRLSPDGLQMRVGYAGANGRPYYSIGKDLIERGAVSREEMSLQAIRNYLQLHPESQDEIMWKNESYVFFKWVSQGPVGSLDTVLTAGRSIATDPRFHPLGALAFMVSEKPVYDSSGKIGSWERFGRWVLNQDAGGAIKGPGRIDLFCGTGEAGERIAGPMKQQGELYYVIKKGLIREELH